MLRQRADTAAPGATRPAAAAPARAQVRVVDVQRASNMACMPSSTHEQRATANAVSSIGGAVWHRLVKHTSILDLISMPGFAYRQGRGRGGRRGRGRVPGAHRRAPGAPGKPPGAPGDPKARGLLDELADEALLESAAAGAHTTGLTCTDLTHQTQSQPCLARKSMRPCRPAGTLSRIPMRVGTNHT